MNKTEEIIKKHLSHKMTMGKKKIKNNYKKIFDLNMGEPIKQLDVILSTLNKKNYGTIHK